MRAVWVDLLDTVMTALGGWVRAREGGGGGRTGGVTKDGGKGGSEGGSSAAVAAVAAAAAAASSRAVEEPMRLLLTLVRALRPRALLRPYARRFVQQLCYLLLADAVPSPSPSTTAPGAPAAAPPSTSHDDKHEKGTGHAPPLLEGESLTAALAVVGELAVISPEDLRPYVDVLMPRYAFWGGV